MLRGILLFSLGGLALALASCDKTPPLVPPKPVINYGDSVLYVRNQSSDYIAYPLEQKAGTYWGFPEGIIIDPASGAINVTKSDAGLKYKISFLAAGGHDTLTSFVTIAGISYLDGFYKLNTKDSVIHPIYNADLKAAVPGINNGSAFDIGSGCNSQGCNVNTSDGQINLAQTVRNGAFGANPVNNVRKEFELVYKINDNSGTKPISMKVKLYYYETMADVTPEIYDIIAERQGTLFLNGVTTPVAVQSRVGRPRPPCIFIVGH